MWTIHPLSIIFLEIRRFSKSILVFCIRDNHQKIPRCSHFFIFPLNPHDMPMICPWPPESHGFPWPSSASKESRRGGLDLAVEGSAGNQEPWAWRLMMIWNASDVLNRGEKIRHWGSPCGFCWTVLNYKQPDRTSPSRCEVESWFTTSWAMCAGFAQVGSVGISSSLPVWWWCELWDKVLGGRSSTKVSTSFNYIYIIINIYIHLNW